MKKYERAYMIHFNALYSSSSKILTYVTLQVTLLYFIIYAYKIKTR